MNATLQSLSNVSALTNYILAYQKVFSNNKIKYDLTNEYAKVIVQLWNSKSYKKYYEPYDFKNKIGEKNPLFKGIAANDSKDLILFIFQELHKELNKPNVNKNINLINLNVIDQKNELNEYKKFKFDYYSVNNSIIQNIFYGEQESFNVCHNCKNKTFNFNIFSFLIFPLEKVRQYLIQKNNGFFKVDLVDCFDNFISEEIMSGSNNMYCNNCHVMSSHSAFNKIYKHPEVFVMILNRGKGLEFEVEFEYPKTFKLNNYINFENNENYKNNNEIIEYELISVISHLGESSMSGHFIAYCKSPVNKKWYLYNDSIVTEANNNFNLLNNNNNSKSIPYVLFYQIKKNNNNKPLYDLQNSNKISVKMENDDSNEITLYFDFSNGKELFLDIKENAVFNNAVICLCQKYNIDSKDFKFYKGNDEEIIGTKTIKELHLKNEEHIKVI
jgi:ubiquitin carboxyl-terminal hydrolase 2/21